MKKLIAGVVLLVAFITGFAAKEYTESFSVDKAKCQRILIFISDTEIKADCYWNLVDGSGRVIKENIRTSCESVIQTNNVTFADIRSYVSGSLKDHYKNQKQSFAGVDE